ncbi:MAG: bifunctional nuclease family protein [Kiritimatiellae bacterium]|nr:bifunctional nuclease family protein [Kiritimatiellia bacterium]
MKPDVQVTVQTLVGTSRGGAGVFLTDGRKVIVMFIDVFVASAIARYREGLRSPRPMTHDLIAAILAGFGARVAKVVVNELKDDTFYARIYIVQDTEHGRNLIEVDARPSDSIALALQQGCPIYVAASVWEKTEDASWMLQQAEEQSSQQDEEEPPTEPPPDEPFR